MERHLLIVPEDPEEPMEVRHVGCWSHVVIMAPDEQLPYYVDDDAPIVTRAVVYSEYLCAVEAEIRNTGLADWFRHPKAEDVSYGFANEVDPGEHEIEYWEEYHPGGPWGGPEVDAGLRLVEAGQPQGGAS